MPPRRVLSFSLRPTTGCTSVLIIISIQIIIISRSRKFYPEIFKRSDTYESIPNQTHHSILFDILLHIINRTRCASRPKIIGIRINICHISYPRFRYRCSIQSLMYLGILTIACPEPSCTIYVGAIFIPIVRYLFIFDSILARKENLSYPVPVTIPA